MQRTCSGDAGGGHSRRYSAAISSHTFGLLSLYQAILPHLREKHRGTLITIGSMAAWCPVVSCNLYNTSKAALQLITLGLAEEVARLASAIDLQPQACFGQDCSIPQQISP